MSKRKLSKHNRSQKIEAQEIDKLAEEYIEVFEENKAKSMRKRLNMRNEFRRRSKKKTKKLTKRQIELIMSQKGKMSTRKCAEWFFEKMDYRFKIGHTTVWWYWNQKNVQEEIEILDLLEDLNDSSEEELEDLIHKIENKEIKIK